MGIRIARWRAEPVLVMAVDHAALFLMFHLIRPHLSPKWTPPILKRAFAAGAESVVGLLAVVEVLVNLR